MSDKGRNSLELEGGEQLKRNTLNRRKHENNFEILGYKIVMEKLGSKHIVPEMNADTMFNIVNTLFPKHDIMEDDITTERQYPVTSFTQKELMDTARRLQNKKHQALMAYLSGY